MAKSLAYSVDLLGNQILNARFQQLAADPANPSEGQFWENTTQGVLKVRLGGVNVTFGRLDQLSAPSGPVNFGSQRATGLADGVNPSDAATVGQITAAMAGLDVKQSVRVASTANANLASPGAAVDGVTLAGGDRVLLKNQTNGAENGVYVFNGSAAAMTRAPDADTAAEVNPGMFIIVEEGTNNGDQIWILTTNNPITLGTTALTFARFPTGGVTKFSQTFGDGASTSGTITHNLGSQDLVHAVRGAVAPFAAQDVEVEFTDANTVTWRANPAPATNSLRITLV